VPEAAVRLSLHAVLRKVRLVRDPHRLAEAVVDEAQIVRLERVELGEEGADRRDRPRHRFPLRRRHDAAELVREQAVELRHLGRVLLRCVDLAVRRDAGDHLLRYVRCRVLVVRHVEGESGVDGRKAAIAARAEGDERREVERLQRRRRKGVNVARPDGEAAAVDGAHHFDSRLEIWNGGRDGRSVRGAVD
jgi:hypothetical protein